MKAVESRIDYEHTLAALGVCVSARIPVLLWGNPGEGKTAAVESASHEGWLVKTVIVTHSDPSDFAGLPVVSPDGAVTLAPPAWAKELADHGGPSIAFFDEFSTASPALQAAVLRPLTHYEVGSLKLPETVSFVATANPDDVSAAGWELAPPTTSRFVHLQWGMPLEIFAEGIVTGDWPKLPIYPIPSDFDSFLTRERILVSGFLKARGSQLSRMPDASFGVTKAFPTPRTWEYSSRLSALANAHMVSPAVRSLLVTGAVGQSAAHEFINWVSSNNLPDPELLLNRPDETSFSGMGPDRIFAILQSILAAVKRNPTPNRWTTAINICAIAAASPGTTIDPVVPVIRSLLHPDNRPSNVTVPPSIKIFGPTLRLSGVIE